jgi:hypothetical protein
MQISGTVITECNYCCYETLKFDVTNIHIRKLDELHIYCPLCMLAWGRLEELEDSDFVKNKRGVND